MIKNTSDVTVIGCGLIGLFSAYVLAKSGISVTILEKKKIPKIKYPLSDIRTTAISEGSKIILQKYGFWQKIREFAEPIKQIKVFDRNEESKISFTNQNKKGFLGYIIENNFLFYHLMNEVLKNKYIKIFDNIQLNNVCLNDNNVLVETNKKNFLSSLLVAADGRNSFVRKTIKQSRFYKKYNQHAIVINFLHLKNHQNTAYEIFNSSGPLATLPMLKSSKNYYSSSLIWSHYPNIIKNFNEINEDLLIALLNERLESILGKVVKIINKQTYPLSAHINSSFINKRTIFIGDAAHSIHPIAGQGWNLGMRDVDALIETINFAQSNGQDLGMAQICKKYQNIRYFDAFSLYQITDKLNSFFMLESSSFKKIRQFGFNIINNNKNINYKISNYAMGFNK